MFTLYTKHQSTPVTLKELYTLRQAFVIAAVLIAGGVVLAHVVHPGFLALPLLVSGGLLLSGVTGFCPMVYLLQKLQKKGI